MTTEITTAARRIARAVNATAQRSTSVFFDHDGVEVARTHGHDQAGPSCSDYYLAGSRGARGERWTVRETQDLLDERAVASSTASFQLDA